MNDTPQPTSDARPADAADAAEPSVDPKEAQVVEALKTIYDPEIPVNIYDLGLIYEIHCYEDDTVFVKMTLTAPNCPAAGILPGQVEQRVRSLPWVVDARVELTFDPPFTQDMMSDEARLALGLM